MSAIGAVLIEGPKACGKTETALQIAASTVRFDTDPNAKATLELNPEALFNQDLPILFDEWQRAPSIWDHVRRHVDDLRGQGLYVLTGSATPTDARELHSGAGRIGTIKMRPMSLFESGHSSGEVSLAALMSGDPQSARQAHLSVTELMERVAIGGWPALLGLDERRASRWLADYLTQIVEVDIPSLGTTRRAPQRLRRTIESLARSVGHPIKVSSVAADLAGSEKNAPDPETVRAYLDALDRLKLTDNSLSWQPHMRSRTRLRVAPVRYFVDPSIGTTALGIGSRELLADLNGAGFHFEALVIRDLRIYAQRLGGEVHSWREANGRKEVDAVIESPSGWSAFEVKLTGDQAVIDEASAGLLAFADGVDQNRHGAPGALAVITATGSGGLRPDGVHVVPISALGP
jgi:predicted AAA+ superfamily ATPase